MVKKRFLSKKKTSRQTITISPFLKDWVKRFVKKQQNSHPNNDYYRSVSSFITYILEENLKILEHGKNLEDLKYQPDKETEDFYNKITFKAITEQFEELSEAGKYLTDDFDFLFPLFSKYRMFMIKYKKSKGKEFTINDFIRGSDRMNNFMKKNNVTKNFELSRLNEKIILEYSGYYPNIHFVLSKALVVIASILGFKILDIFYEKNYTRLDMVPTDLFPTPKLLKNERKKLYRQNIKLLINYYNLIKDEDHHLWLNLAKNSNTFISFQTVDVGFKKIKEMIDEISSNVIREEIPGFVIEIFKKLGWIEKKHEKLTYELLISPNYNKIELEIMEKVNEYIKSLNIVKKIEKSNNLYQFIASKKNLH
ncbi:MAG: hypothetical protein ACOC44_07795 [Promethearchaeia archaeon]